MEKSQADPRLRLPSERQQPVSLPQHLVAALQSADGGSTYQNTGAPKGLSQPPSIGALAGTPQQVAAAPILNRNVPSPMPILGATTLDGAAAASPMFANSPRSGNTSMMDLTPQQQQQSLLQRQKMQQMQKQQQQQQQQQLRQPATPPMGQAHFQQLQQAQLQQQAQERHHLHLQQQLQQHRIQQQQQQLQSNSLQPGQQLQQSLAQNHLAQAGQMKTHLGPMGSNPAGSLFGNTQMSSNMMANLGANIQPAMLQQRLHLQGVGMGASGQPQRSLPSQLLSDPMYNMGLAGTQNAANLGLPLQQQLVGQSNFNSILNPNQTLNFGQQRQQQPPQ